jgi:hypothetical protein
MTTSRSSSSGPSMGAAKSANVDCWIRLLPGPPASTNSGEALAAEREARACRRRKPSFTRRPAGAAPFSGTTT